MPDLFDWGVGEGKRRRDTGMEEVLNPEQEFKVAIAQYIDNLPHGWQGTGEDIRLSWKGVTPHHPNCWGAVCFAAIKRHTLVKFPNYDMRRPVDPKSHARPTYIYRRV